MSVLQMEELPRHGISMGLMTGSTLSKKAIYWKIYPSQKIKANRSRSVVEAPDRGEPGVSWTKSISQAISGMAYDLYDFQCIPGDTCVVNPAASICEISPQAYFVLKAMANLNNFLNSMANTVLSAQADITDSTGNMVKIFTTVGVGYPSSHFMPTRSYN